MSCSENTDSTDCDWDFSINPAKEITRLRAALAEAERDAARYRWLRIDETRMEEMVRRIEDSDIETSADLDAAIDAAMAREEG